MQKIFFSAVFSLVRSFHSTHGNDRFIGFRFPEFNNAVCQCKEGEVPSQTNILTRMIHGAALTNDDVSRDGSLAAVDFYAQPFAFGITAVLYATFTFFMCHNKEV